jgi:hypothetical protein
MIPGVPTLNPSGFSNALPGSFGARVPMQWPPAFYSFFTDFDEFDGAATGTRKWMVTTVQAGTLAGTLAVTDAANGVLLITTDDAIGDGSFAQLAGYNNIATVADVAETFQFAAGKEVWFSTRFLLSDVVNSNFMAGLAISDTTPLDATDGVFFLKASGAATIALTSKIVTPVTASRNLTVTLVNSQFVELGFHYNGVDSVSAFQGGNSDGTWNFVGSVGVNALPTRTLALTFGFNTSTAGAKTCQMDYIFAARER